jgi:hypothetical protein
MKMAWQENKAKGLKKSRPNPRQRKQAYELKLKEQNEHSENSPVRVPLSSRGS